MAGRDRRRDRRGVERCEARLLGVLLDLLVAVPPEKQNSRARELRECRRAWHNAFALGVQLLV